MIKKNLFMLSCAVTGLVTGLFATVLSGVDTSAVRTFGDEPPVTTYTFTLSDFNTNNFDDYTGLYTAYTQNGNEIKLKFYQGSDYGYSFIQDGYLYLGRGGYLSNQTELRGIQSALINFSVVEDVVKEHPEYCKLRCSTGTSPVDFLTDYRVVMSPFDPVIQNGVRKDFTGVNQRNFFHIHNPDDESLVPNDILFQISSIEIVYTCETIVEDQFTFTYNNIEDNYSIAVNTTNATSLAVPATYNGKPVIANKGFLKNCTNLTGITFERFPISSVGNAGNVPLLYYFTDDDLPVYENSSNELALEYNSNSGYDCIHNGRYANYNHEACAEAFRNIVPGLLDIRVLSGVVGSYVFYQVCNWHGNHKISIGREVTTVGAHAFEMLDEDPDYEYNNLDTILMHHGNPRRIESYAFAYVRDGCIYIYEGVLEMGANAFAFSSIASEDAQYRSSFLYVPFKSSEIPAGFETGWNNNGRGGKLRVMFANTEVE